MITYAYAPIEDFEFDQFLPQMVKAKNSLHDGHAYHLIHRAADCLSVIENFDRLYVGIHGSETGRVYVKEGMGQEPLAGSVRDGSQLVDMLIARGLPKKRFKLRLWVCNSASTPTSNEHFPAMDTNLVGQVASRLRGRGYYWVHVTGYRAVVSLSVGDIVATGHRALMDEHQALSGTAGHKETKFSLWQRSR